MNNNMFGLMASITNGHDLKDEDYSERKKKEYQWKIDNKFNKSTSLRTIEEEYPYGSGEYRPLVCRVVGVRTVETGNKMSDSYKKLIFKEQEHPKNNGYIYRFDNNYWVTYNTSILSGTTDSVVIRRCNNILRWKDEAGNIKWTPVAFDEDAFYLNNELKQEINRKNGYRKAIIQRNEDTLKIKPNQRFIVGTECLKVSGSGLNGFLNQNTIDDSGPSVIKVNFEYDFINTNTDDLINKVADAYASVFSINIDQSYSKYSVSDTYNVFTATAFKNGNKIDVPFMWDCESKDVEAIQDGNNFNVKFLNEGNCSIKVRIKDNENIEDVKDISITNTETYHIEYSPILNKMLKGEEQEFIFSLFSNSKKIECDFTFEKIDDLLEDNYIFNILSNDSFSIKNNKMSSKSVVIKCIPNGYDVEPLLFNITLGGAW